MNDPLFDCRDEAHARALLDGTLGRLLVPFVDVPPEAHHIAQSHRRPVKITRRGRVVKVESTYLCTEEGRSLACVDLRGGVDVFQPSAPGDWTAPLKQRAPFTHDEPDGSRALALRVGGAVVGRVHLDYVEPRRMRDLLAERGLGEYAPVPCPRGADPECRHVGCRAARAARLAVTWDADHPDHPSTSNPWLWSYAVSPLSPSTEGTPTP